MSYECSSKLVQHITVHVPLKLIHEWRTLFCTASVEILPSLYAQKLSIYRSHSIRKWGPLSWHPGLTRGVRARLMYRWFDFTTSCSVTASPPPPLTTLLIHSLLQSNTLSRNFCGPRDCFHICEGKLNLVGGMLRPYRPCPFNSSLSSLGCARFSV